jgi:hypothetical protein
MSQTRSGPAIGPVLLTVPQTARVLSTSEWTRWTQTYPLHAVTIWLGTRRRWQNATISRSRMKILSGRPGSDRAGKKRTESGTAARPYGPRAVANGRWGGR